MLKDRPYALLAEEIRACDGDERPASSPPPSRWQKFQITFTQLTRALQGLEPLLTEGIFGDDFDLATTLCEVAPSEWSRERLAQVREVAEMLGGLS